MGLIYGGGERNSKGMEAWEERRRKNDEVNVLRKQGTYYRCGRCLQVYEYEEDDRSPRLPRTESGEFGPCIGFYRDLDPCLATDRYIEVTYYEVVALPGGRSKIPGGHPKRS